MRTYPRTSYRNPFCLKQDCSDGKFKHRLCRTHYLETLIITELVKDSSCRVAHCNKRVHGKGFCVGHYYDICAHWSPCRAEGCPKLSRHLGLCPAHYAQDITKNPSKHQNRIFRKGCAVNGCELKHWSKGLCRKHFRRQERNGDPTVVKIAIEHPERCAYPRCNEKYAARGYCRTHYARLLNTGATNLPSHLSDKFVQCLVSGCSEKTRAKHGHCRLHYSYAPPAKKAAEKYRKTDKGHITRIRRDDGLIHATPAWADRNSLADIYRKCPVGLQVDHIIPIKGHNVSGLHVPWNLQYLSLSENSSKGNSFDGTRDNEGWRQRFLRRRKGCVNG